MDEYDDAADEIFDPYKIFAAWGKLEQVLLEVNKELPPGNRFLTTQEAEELADRIREEWISDIDGIYDRNKIWGYLAQLQICEMIIDNTEKSLQRNLSPDLNELKKLRKKIKSIDDDLFYTYTHSIPDEVQTLKEKWIKRGVSEEAFLVLNMNPRIVSYIDSVYRQSNQIILNTLCWPDLDSIEYRTRFKTALSIIKLGVLDTLRIIGLAYNDARNALYNVNLTGCYDGMIR